LEDNEEHISRCALGAHGYALAAADRYPGEFPAHLSHPFRSKEFMARADGFSLLIESLARQKPASAPHVVFWPAVDSHIFHSRPRNEILRKQLNIAADNCVLVYHGNVHQANFHEVRSLYLAVALLNRSGVPARLIRLGHDCLPLTDEYKRWAAEFAIDLGFVIDRQRVADVLASADVLVQPGKADPFNDYRFPSKLPEFFAMARPVVMPRTNIGAVAHHLEDAYVLENADGASIRDAVAQLWADPSLRDKLAAGACKFAARFSWHVAARRLLGLYRQLEASPVGGLNKDQGAHPVAA
jgi:glycosyltransferase involved in cell wall biosynthesis